MTFTSPPISTLHGTPRFTPLQCTTPHFTSLLDNFNTVFKNEHTNTIVRYIGICALLVSFERNSPKVQCSTFWWDIPFVFYRSDTIYITGSQNTTKFIALYCTICYTTTCFGPFSRPSSGCICLALRVLYHDNKISA